MAHVETLVIRRAQSGDQEAWYNLFEWHFEPIYRYCLNLASGRQEVAEEITQEVFVTAARRINSFKPQRGTFRAWLLGIARNRFMKFKSKEIRRQRNKGQFPAKGSESQKERSPHLLVHEVIARLPSHYRLVLEAKYLKGQTVNQIAEARRSTVKATESLLGRAREKFAQVYIQMRDQ
ncbi:MAG: sigma-70 family RNA polymerase sigma factor [Desulfobacterales bacterium]|nr:sigma-70 family RNA polymerase sigma factor [Desulfobacterales bacterium]